MLINFLKQLFKKNIPDQKAAGIEPADYLALSHKLFESGDLVESKRAAIQSLERKPDCIESLFQLGTIAVAFHNYEEAIEYFNSALEISPGNAAVLCSLGNVQKDNGDMDSAISCFNKAIKSDPTQPHSYFNLALVYFELNNFDSALMNLDKCRELSRGEPWNDRLSEMLTTISKNETCPVPPAMEIHKLENDLGQINYLMDEGIFSSGYSEVAESYANCISVLNKQSSKVKVPKFVADTYNKPLYIEQAKPWKSTTIDTELDFEKIQDDYLNSNPNVLVVDNLLTQDCLTELRKFCLRNFIWHDVREGYLGAYMYEGFYSELLLKLARDFTETMPRIFKGHNLQIMWAYKYANNYMGIGTHADEAAVNVNFWITEEDANLDKESGGLVIYEHDAPKDWGFAKYNTDARSIHEYLKSVGSKEITVPCRENRGVIFDSDLFHETDNYKFKDGYTNKRINVTMLFGNRQ